MATIDAFLSAARAELGYTESPAGSNCNKFSHALGRPCERWCADFLVSTADRVGLILPSRSASTQVMLAAFRSAGRAHTSPAAGDFAFWQFDSDAAPDHVSVVEQVNPDGTVATIDGNSSASGSQSNGGQVCRRTRPVRLVIAFGRPDYSAPAPPAPIDYPEDAMVRHDKHSPLDDQGNGYIDAPEIPATAIVSIVANGDDPSGPAGDVGYKPVPRFSRLAWGGGSRIVIVGGPPRGAVDFTVWTAA